MALFFDQHWFDARLGTLGRTRAELAATLGLSRTQLEDMWKDQREVRAADVTVMAEFLGVSAAEIADRCGVATPQAPEPDRRSSAADAAALDTRLSLLETRICRLEQLVGDIARENDVLRAGGVNVEGK